MVDPGYFVFLVADGAMAGAIYALVALAFVIVYKASRIMNFAVGEWVMLGSRLVATGLHALGWGLPGALVMGAAGMAAFAVTWNRLILARLVGQPLISLIMVTIGLGMVMRGAAALVFAGVPGRIVLPLAGDPVHLLGIALAADKLTAAAMAAAVIAVLSWFFQKSRMGLALRAVADDQQSAMMAGINLPRYFAITWALMGLVSVLAGTLWTVVAGGGFGLVLVGLKVFPIVIIGGLDSVAGSIVGALA